MGNNKCKQCSASVFENEEDEETWFEWMESTGQRNQKSISPRTQPLPVQPLAFQADIIRDRPKKNRSKPALYSTEGNALKGLHLASYKNDRTSKEPTFPRDAENNNHEPAVDDETVCSQVREKLNCIETIGI